jgi:hypothetical protein
MLTIKPWISNLVLTRISETAITRYAKIRKIENQTSCKPYLSRVMYCISPLLMNAFYPYFEKESRRNTTVIEEKEVTC